MTERNDRSIAAMVTEIDDLHAELAAVKRERDCWKWRAEQLDASNIVMHKRLELADSDYADLKTDIEELREAPGAVRFQRGRIAALEKELAAERHAADALRREVAGLHETFRSIVSCGQAVLDNRAEPPAPEPARAHDAPQPAPQIGNVIEGVASFLSNPLVRSFGKQAFKSFQNSTRPPTPSRAVVDSRAGGVEQPLPRMAPPPARHPEQSAPEVNPVSAPSGADLDLEDGLGL